MSPRLMAAPYAAGLVLLIAAPAAATLGLAFFEYDLIGAPAWAGGANFAELLEDPGFGRSILWTLAYLGLAVPLRVGGALALALLLHRPFRGAGLHRAAAYLPTVVPDVALALLWLFLVNPLYGPMPVLLGAVGLPVPDFLTSPGGAVALVVLMSAFTIGEGFVIALSVRRELPAELHDLARAEGASPVHAFRRVTLPLMSPTLALLACRDVALSLQAAFVPALLIFDGGPDRATTFVPLLAYRTAFEYGRYGYAAAMTAVTLAFTLVAVVVALPLLRRGRLPLG